MPPRRIEPRSADYFYYGFKLHVSAAARRAQAARELTTLRKTGRALAPVRIDGRKIATTFWGKAWCENLERYSDFANRLPRGRTYVRNGSVLDLQIEGGRATALVSGSSVYTTVIDVIAIGRGRGRWRDICGTAPALSSASTAVDSASSETRLRRERPRCASEAGRTVRHRLLDGYNCRLA